MTKTPILPRAISFAMALMVTWSMLAGIDTLAHQEHAAQGLMAAVATASTAA